MMAVNLHRTVIDKKRYKRCIYLQKLCSILDSADIYLQMDTVQMPDFPDVRIAGEFPFSTCQLIETFDVPTPAAMKFSFQNLYYQEVFVGQSFAIMEGSHQVREGNVIAIENGNIET